MIRDGLPPRLYAHTREEIDFAALAGKRVAVLGRGRVGLRQRRDRARSAARARWSSAFAAPSLVNVNAYRWAEFVGFLRHLGDLPDVDKWRFIRQIVRMGQLPPADTVERARGAGRLPAARGLRLERRRGARRHRGDPVRRRRDARGRLRHRRHRLRDRSGAPAGAGRGGAPHRALVGSLFTARGRASSRICCATRTSVPGSSTPRRCRARRRTSRTSTTTPSGGS